MKEERQTRHTFAAILLLALLSTSMLLAYPIPLTQTIGSSAKSITSNMTPGASHIIRVAIYDEKNLTSPSYDTNPGGLHNNATQLAAMLQSHGVTATLLSVKDISNHKLKTADYDVLALVDNLPRENITNAVREFWLGGGGLLVFDSAAAFLCYFGILPPEASGSDGFFTYWRFLSNDINVTARHPVAISYNVNTIIATATGYVRWSWSALLGSSIANDLTRVARSQDDPDSASVLAFDPSNRGGKVVTFSYDYNYESLPSLNQMIVDAVYWLCPHPKARIVYDLSHNPDYGVDSWDTLASTPLEHSEWRNALVNRSYTFDKLYPSSIGNLTSSNLAPYRLLIIACPHINFTSAEVSAVTSWIGNGGSLLIFGERPGGSYTLDDENVNYLLSNLNLRINLTATYTGSLTYHTEHPTVESCAQLNCLANGFINYTSPAYPIWGLNSKSIMVAAQEYGYGRVILIPDLSMFRDNRIGLYNHYQYAINLVNWLTASEARALLYVDEPFSPNYYRTPVCQALNDLGIQFALTFSGHYLNLSLNIYSWDLVIIDNPMSAISAYFDEISDYLDTGGRLIFSSYLVDTHPTDLLWAKLGFTYAADITLGNTLYIWNPSHDIIKVPNAYGAAKFIPYTNYGDDGDMLTVLDNATALAGTTPGPTAGNAVIILRNDGKTLYNGYLIDEFSGDFDNSTYQDRLELWENEIVFMMPAAAGPVAEFPVILAVAIVAVIAILALVAAVVMMRRRKAPPRRGK